MMVLQQPVASTELKKIAPPGPPGLPFVGMLPFLSSHLYLKLYEISKKYGNICQLNLDGKNVIVLNGLEAIQEALVKQKDCFTKISFDQFKKPPMCYLIEFKSGELWKQHRAMAGKVMHSFVGCQPDKLESWGLEEAAELTDIFINCGGKAFDPNLYIPLATLSFMQRLMFSKKSSLKDYQEDTNFVKTSYGLRILANGGQTVTNLQMVPAIWRGILLLSRWKLLFSFFQTLNIVDSYFLENIKHHEKSFDPDNVRDITDALFKISREQTETVPNNFQLREDDIITGTVSQFMAPGAEISRLMLQWALLYMIAYPEVQAQIHKELDEVVGSGQQPSLQHRDALPFTEACINEILRHASPTNLPAVPYTTITDTTLGGYFIPQNSPVFVNYYSLTRDERYWEKPSEFNPYRFLDENGKFRNKLLDKFYPFGVGSRRCIGEYLGRLQIFLFFTNLMHKCKFEKIAGDKLNLEPQPGLFGGPKNYKVVAKPRF